MISKSLGSWLFLSSSGDAKNTTSWPFFSPRILTNKRRYNSRFSKMNVFSREVPALFSTKPAMRFFNQLNMVVLTNCDQAVHFCDKRGIFVIEKTGWEVI